MLLFRFERSGAERSEEAFLFFPSKNFSGFFFPSMSRGKTIFSSFSSRSLFFLSNSIKKKTPLERTGPASTPQRPFWHWRRSTLWVSSTGT